MEIEMSVKDFWTFYPCQGRVCVDNDKKAAKALGSYLCRWVPRDAVTRFRLRNKLTLKCIANVKRYTKTGGTRTPFNRVKVKVFTSGKLCKVRSAMPVKPKPKPDAVVSPKPGQPANTLTAAYLMEMLGRIESVLNRLEPVLKRVDKATVGFDD